MTAINQNFSMYQGDTKNIIIPVEGVETLTGVTAKWGVRKKEYSTTNEFTKDTTTGGITIQGNELRIKLEPADTLNLAPGTYFHEFELKDQQNNVSTMLTGLMTINRSGV